MQPSQQAGQPGYQAGPQSRRSLFVARASPSNKETRHHRLDAADRWQIPQESISPFASFGTDTKRAGGSVSRDRNEFVRRSLSRELEPLRSVDLNVPMESQNTKLASVIQSKNAKLQARQQELHRQILSLADDLQTLQEEVDTGDMQNKLSAVALQKKKEELEQRKEIKQRQVTRVMFLLQKREEILSALLRPETSPDQGLSGNLPISKAILQLVTTGKVQTPRFRQLENVEGETQSLRGSHVDDQDSIDAEIGPLSPGWGGSEDGEGSQIYESSPEIVGNIENIRELTDEEVDHVVFCTAEMKRAVTKWICEESQRLFRKKTLVVQVVNN